MPYSLQVLVSLFLPFFLLPGQSTPHLPKLWLNPVVDSACVSSYFTEATSVTRPASCLLFADKELTQHQGLDTSANSVITTPKSRGTLWTKGKEECKRQRNREFAVSPRDVTSYTHKNLILT